MEVLTSVDLSVAGEASLGNLAVDGVVLAGHAGDRALGRVFGIAGQSTPVRVRTWSMARPASASSLAAPASYPPRSPDPPSPDAYTGTCGDIVVSYFSVIPSFSRPPMGQRSPPLRTAPPGGPPSCPPSCRPPASPPFWPRLTRVRRGDRPLLLLPRRLQYRELERQRWDED